MSDDLVKRLEDVRCEGVEELCWEAADRIEQLAAINEELEAKLSESEALLAKAVDVIKWFIDNDETNEGDYPMPDRGNRTWNEINAYWIDGLNRARALLATLAELTGGDE